jgi:hypothetical protein
VNLESLLYAQRVLPNLSSQPAEAKLTIGNTTHNVKIKKNETKVFWVTPGDAPNVKYNVASGAMSAIAVFEAPATVKDASSGGVTLNRKYFVNGIETSKLHEGDLVEIRLYPKFTASAVDGAYQLTDILPAGLTEVTDMYVYRGYNPNNACNILYPYEVVGQVVKFMISGDSRYYGCLKKDGVGEYGSYYARVSSLGTYGREKAALQSTKSDETVAYGGDSAPVVIEK